MWAIIIFNGVFLLVPYCIGIQVFPPEKIPQKEEIKFRTKPKNFSKPILTHFFSFFEVMTFFVCFFFLHLVADF